MATPHLAVAIAATVSSPSPSPASVCDCRIRSLVGRDIGLFFLCLALCIIANNMASLHELREVPVQGDYFLSFDDLLEVIRDASVKHKFSFKTPHKDPKRARYRCANKDCPWKVNAHRNPENNDEVIVDEVTTAHTCVGDAISKRGAANCQEWVGYRALYGR